MIGGMVMIEFCISFTLPCVDGRVVNVMMYWYASWDDTIALMLGRANASRERRRAARKTWCTSFAFSAHPNHGGCSIDLQIHSGDGEVQS